MALLPIAKARPTRRRCLFYVAASILVPIIIIGIVIAVMLPKGEIGAVGSGLWAEEEGRDPALAPSSDAYSSRPGGETTHTHTAPDAKPTQITIRDIKLNGFESVTVDMDIAMDIVNTNM